MSDGQKPVYPWVRDDGTGCIFGKERKIEVAELTKKVEKWEQKVDGMREQMSRQAVAFGVAALLLAIDIALNLLNLP
jgi:hypothetical protein